MQLKNLATGVVLLLPDDLLWSDEHAWTPATASVSYLITGALLVQSALRQAGRPMTLTGAQDMAWVRAPGFRLHTDVDRIVRTCEIDWDRFLEMVHSLQVKTAVYLSLALANDLLRTPIPTHVLENIAPPQWKVRLMVHWLLRVGLFVRHRFRCRAAIASERIQDKPLNLVGG